MTWWIKPSGRCAGIFVAFGLSLLVLYQIAVQQTTIPLFQQSSIRQDSAPSFHQGSARSLLVLHPDRVVWRCPEELRILRTVGPGFCLGSNNIFFIETAQSKSLNPRQACAIESAARHHPTHNIMVLMTPTDAIDLKDRLMTVLKSIDNVHLVNVDIATMVYGTPYFEWYTSNVWKKSPYKITHMSDALRFFLLYNYGGMYLDMDVVVLRPLSNLRNTVVRESEAMTGSSVMFFDRGHEILFRCMSDFVSHYDPVQFGVNGPKLINRNVKKYCSVDLLSKVDKPRCGVDVLPEDRAYPIPYQRWEEYFSPSKVTRLSQRFKNSYLIHAWNFLSGKKPIVIGGNSLYEVAMKENCPLVYKHVQQFTSV